MIGGKTSIRYQPRECARRAHRTSVLSTLLPALSHDQLVHLCQDSKVQSSELMQPPFVPTRVLKVNSVLYGIPGLTHLPRKMSHSGILLPGIGIDPFPNPVHGSILWFCD